MSAESRPARSETSSASFRPARGLVRKKFRFSDATNPNQTVLFNEPNIGELASTVRARFAGREPVTAADVRVFVENETAYLKKHMTPALQELEHGGFVYVQPTKADGTKRKANSYPDNAALKFQ